MKSEDEGNRYPETTAKVTDISLHESGRIAIQLTLLVDPNRLVEVGTDLMRSGVQSLSQLRKLEGEEG